MPNGKAIGEVPNLNGKEPKLEANLNGKAIMNIGKIIEEFKLPTTLESVLREFGVDCEEDLKDFEEEDIQEFELELKKLDTRKFKQKQNIRKFKLMINHFKSH